MTKQFQTCPQCANSDLTTYTHAAVCRECGWSLPESDPRYRDHVQEVGRGNVKGAFVEAIDALPSNFVASLTAADSTVPANHPARGEAGSSLTGAEFKMQREELGLSADWLSERLGVALKTVQRWENGHRAIPQGVIDEMDIISTATQVTAVEPLAEHILAAPDTIVTIPRSGTHLGFPASWYRALVGSVREHLQSRHVANGMTASRFRVVYLDEVEEQK